MKRIFALVTLSFLVLMAACQQGPAGTATPTPGASIPNVVIIAPLSNYTAQSGEQVSIRSTSVDPEGIVLVELLVDNQLVQNSPTPNGQPQSQFSVIQNWTAGAPGTHTITVKATNSKLGVGQANITINVEQKIAQATATLVINPTAVIPTLTALPATVTPNPSATPSGPSTCTLASTFINDVTIPDGTVIAPGGAFVKTWAIQNSGTCTWGGGYNAVFVAGQTFGASSPQPIASAGPGDIINISIPMVAPTAPGSHNSVWQLQASNGVLFGTKFDAVIVVPGAPTPIPPTPRPPTAIPPSGCNGTPVFNGFAANPQTINAGQTTTLSWGLVQNASSVFLTSPSGSQGVGSPGSQQVQPSTTTTYTLTAYCNNVPAQVQVTVNVNGGGGGCNGTPVFNGFSANPQTINAGQESTLSWGLVQNANAVFLQLPNKSEGVASPGSRNVKPGASTTYSLVAYCGNNQAKVSVTVNVNGGCQGNPNFNGFTANPSTISPGQSSVLSWGIVTNATSVVLKTPQGNSGVATPGQITVNPGSTTTYTLIAYCNNTSVQTSVTVTVNAPPPTKTPVPQPNSVSAISAQPNGKQQFRVSVTYYWNNQDAPAVIRTRGFGAKGNQITQTTPASAIPYTTHTAVSTVHVNPDRTVATWESCIVGKSGTELACKTVPAQ